MSEDALVHELSKAPWPAYLRVMIRCTDGKRRGFVFMLPRKCASNSIKDALAFMPGCNFLASRRYLSVEELRASSVPRIAAIRHPVSRLVSCYRSQVVENRAMYIRTPGIYAGMSWDEFVTFVCGVSDEHSDYHFRQYTDELISIPGREPDEVMRVESLEQDWARITGRFRWPQIEPRWLNASETAEASVAPEQHERIERRYIDDSIYWRRSFLT